MTPQEWLKIDARLVAHAEGLGRKPSDTLTELYCSHLARLPYDTVVAGLTRCEKKQKFFPSVSEILDACCDVELEHASETGRAFPTPEEAWLEIANLAGRKGNPRVCHPAVHRAVAQLGGLDGIWHELQFSGAPEGITRHRFVELYREEVERHRWAVKAALHAGERDPLLFPRWTEPRVGRVETWEPLTERAIEAKTDRDNGKGPYDPVIVDGVVIRSGLKLSP